LKADQMTMSGYDRWKGNVLRVKTLSEYREQAGKNLGFLEKVFRFLGFIGF